MKFSLIFIVSLISVSCAHKSNSTLEKNKEVARKVFTEVLGQGKISENEHLYAENFKAHGLNTTADRAQDREATEGWRSAFPDLKMTIDLILAEKDLVCVRFIGEGTNTATGNGLPATGNKMRVSGTTIFRIVDGKIQDEWTDFDQYELLSQLGLLPD